MNNAAVGVGVGSNQDFSPIRDARIVRHVREAGARTCGEPRTQEQREGSQGKAEAEGQQGSCDQLRIKNRGG